MKQQKQQTGVRKWFGDDWLNIQDELMAIFEAHFGHFGQQFILSGCNVAATTVSAGIVCLSDGSGGYKLCRFAGAAGVTFPAYFQVSEVEETRVYLDGVVKPVAVNYNAVLTGTQTGSLLELKSDNSTPRFTDVIQDSTHRFVSDAEKTSYSGQANTAITTLRDGVSSLYNTLAKLKNYIDARTPEAVDLEALKAELRGDVGEVYDTMEEIVDYIDSLAYLPEFRGRAELTGNTIEWEGKPELFKVLTDDVELDASNLIVGKTIGLYLTGAYEATFAAKFKKIVGSPDPDPAEVNYIQMKCLNATSGSELIVYTVMYIES